MNATSHVKPLDPFFDLPDIDDQPDFTTSKSTVRDPADAAGIQKAVPYPATNRRMRGFEYVNRIDSDIKKIVDLPKRSTAHSAGYDFTSPFYVVIEPGQTKKIPTTIKAYMQPDEYLAIHIRSSLGIKYNLRLANCTGIIDSDYYSNPDNDGEIIIAITNEGSKPYEIKFGERFAQGIFCKYLLADDDNAGASRTGGIGSTDK